MIRWRSGVKLTSKREIFSVITEWALLGLISSNRDVPLHSAAETITPPTPPYPRPLSLSPSTITSSLHFDHPPPPAPSQMPTGTANELNRNTQMCPIIISPPNVEVRHVAYV